MHRLVMLVVALSFVASAALAAPQRFVIDSINVEDPSGIPDRVIVSETRLNIGESYSEADLLQAVYRIRRLPLVLRASYRLEPSPTMPDAHRLVLVVVPAHRFNYALDTMALVRDDFTGGIFVPSIGYRSFVGPNQFDVIVGGTDFSGGGGDFRSLVGGYSGYDILGKGIVASLSASRRLYFSSGGESSRSGLNPSARVSVPITRLQSIVGRFNRLDEEHDIAFGSTRGPIPGTVKLKSDTADILWSYDTTDDPFFALRGVTIEAGPRYVRSRNEFPSFTGFPQNPRVDVFPEKGRETALTVDAARFFPLTTRTTLRAGVNAAASRSRFERPNRTTELDQYIAEPSLTYGFNYGPFSGTAQEMSGLRRFRIEGGLVYTYLQFKSSQGSRNEDRLGLTAGFNYRYPWGRININIQYFQE